MLGPQFSSISIASIATLLLAVSARAAIEKLPREPQQANPGAPVGTGIGVVCTTIVAPFYVTGTQQTCSMFVQPGYVCLDGPLGKHRRRGIHRAVGQSIDLGANAPYVTQTDFAASSMVVLIDGDIDQEKEKL